MLSSGWRGIRHSLEYNGVVLKQAVAIVFLLFVLLFFDGYYVTMSR